MKKLFLITLMVAIIVAAGAFFGGMTFQKSRDSLAGLSGQDLTKKMQQLGLSGNGFGGDLGSRNFNGNINGRNFPGGGFMVRNGGGGFTNGEIIRADSSSLTIKQQDGSTKTVYYSSSTTVSKMATGTTADLSVGTNVTANGTANSDGSVTATTIQIRPAGTDTPQDTPPAI